MKVRRTIKLMLCTLALVLVAGHVRAETLAGTVSIELRTVAIGIGTTSGNGKLTLNDGTERFFSISGISVIDVGISSSNAVGEVYDLNNVEDFAGTYTAGAAGIAIGGGVGTSRMANEKGVVMTLSSTQAGIRFTLAPGGATVTLAPSALK